MRKSSLYYANATDKALADEIGKRGEIPMVDQQTGGTRVVVSIIWCNRRSTKRAQFVSKLYKSKDEETLGTNSPTWRIGRVGMVQL